MVIGGNNDVGDGTSSKVEQLNLRTNTWKKMEDLSCKRSAMSSVSISFNKFNRKARDTFRLEIPDMISDDGEILTKEDDVSVGNSVENMDTASVMSLYESDEEMLE